MVPKYIDKKNRPKLNNDIYFGGRQAYSEWQDKYAKAMQDKFQELHRGIKNSKATHIQIKQFYQIINQTYNEKDYKEVLAKAQNSILLEKEVNKLEKTLEVYWKSNTDIKDQLQDIKKDKETFRQTIKAVSQIYKIPQGVIIEIIKGIENDKFKNIDRGKELKK